MSVILNYRGGLGNQLFQIAMSKLIEKTLGIKTSICLDSYNSYEYGHEFLFSDILKREIVNVKNIRNDIILIESENYFGIISYLKENLKTGKDFIIQGYWQDYNLLNIVKVELLFLIDEFISKQDISSFVVDEVGYLHIRRHEYGHHGLLKKEYYLDGLKHVKNQNFKIVTDEPIFSKNAYANVNGFTGVINHKNNPILDFSILCSGKFHIIANSTFSWWAGWYSIHRGISANVYMPSDWCIFEFSHNFRDPNIKIIQTELILP